MKKKGGGGHGGGGHDAAGGMRWLLTYADLITLLLILFIMLYSMSAVDAQKFKMMAMYLRAAFGGVLTQGPTFLPGQGDRIIPDLVQKLSAAVEGPGGEGQAGQGNGEVFRNERGIVVRLMTDNVLFNTGSADVSPEMRTVLDAIAKPLIDSGQPILVEGHTDDLPVRRGRFASNWELSTARASAVVRYLVEKCHVPAVRLSAAGYADNHPVVPNRDEASRRRNRRIDIVVLEGPAAKALGPVTEAPKPAPAPAVPASLAVPPVPGTPAVPAPPAPGTSSVAPPALPPLPGAGPKAPVAPPLPPAPPAP